MLFRKKIEKSCTYCAHGAMLDDETVLCAKKGLRPISSKCFRFRYDATKRVPKKAKAIDFSQYSEKDFSL